MPPPPQVDEVPRPSADDLLSRILDVMAQFPARADRSRDETLVDQGLEINRSLMRIACPQERAILVSLAHALARRSRLS